MSMPMQTGQVDIFDTTYQKLLQHFSVKLRLTISTHGGSRTTTPPTTDEQRHALGPNAAAEIQKGGNTDTFTGLLRISQRMLNATKHTKDAQLVLKPFIKLLNELNLDSETNEGPEINPNDPQKYLVAAKQISILLEILRYMQHNPDCNDKTTEEQKGLLADFQKMVIVISFHQIYIQCLLSNSSGLKAILESLIFSNEFKSLNNGQNDQVLTQLYQSAFGRETVPTEPIELKITHNLKGRFLGVTSHTKLHEVRLQQILCLMDGLFAVMLTIPATPPPQLHKALIQCRRHVHVHQAIAESEGGVGNHMIIPGFYA